MIGSERCDGAACAFLTERIENWAGASEAEKQKGTVGIPQMLFSRRQRLRSCRGLSPIALIFHFVLACLCVAQILLLAANDHKRARVFHRRRPWLGACTRKTPQKSGTHEGDPLGKGNNQQNTLEHKYRQDRRMGKTWVNHRLVHQIPFFNRCDQSGKSAPTHNPTW